MWAHRDGASLAGDDRQLEIARQSAAGIETALNRRPVTRIETFGHFWIAEEYHQKYYLRNDRVLNSELRSIYPEDADFVASSAAARVNGYLHGGSIARLEADLPGLGLSGVAATRLAEHCR